MTQRQTNIEENFGDNIDDNDENEYLLASFLSSKNGVRQNVQEISTIITHKRGLPHVHIIIRVNPKLPIDQVDKIISAEMPQENMHLRELVKKFMIHKQQHSPRYLRNKDLKTVNGTVFSSYQEAAQEMGLFKIDNENVFTKKEAVENFYTFLKLHFLFVQLILDAFLAIELWKKFNNYLFLDIQEQTCYNHTLSINITL
ncbi:41172_t:CDS:2 [Gigaspora margarita]|uniref:41172_t:CDS:1 n=1 Tax=Gigaspora margarita TaxID=4874 RepID=A0ABN7WEG4_GIGMA|nr:41172_t:CDS:2 [Gigaspora margarita]